MVSLRQIIVLGVAAALPLGSQTPVRSESALQMPAPQILAQAADARSRVKTQANTALTHARLAAGANDVNLIWQHLQHVINCIGGAKDRRYNTNWGNVCEGQDPGLTGIVTSLYATNKPGDWGLGWIAATAVDLAGLGKESKEVVDTRVIAKGVEALMAVFVREFK